MEKWFKICLLLCLFGVLKELRPSEPFLTQYLVGPWKNLTTDEVYSEIFPVWTYSYLALLVVVFLVTDFLLYKPVIVFEGICYIMTWCVLIWGQGVAAMQGVEFLYAAATATQIAYNTYIYAQVPLSKFQVVTAYTQAALLTGRCIAGILGQVLVATGLCDYYTLNFISLAFVSAATVVACFLPNVSQSIYFHRGKPKENDKALDQLDSPNMGRVTDGVDQITSNDSTASETEWTLASVYQLLWIDFKSSFSNAYMLKWSLWWAFAMCGYFQVLNYIQPLWETVAPSGTNNIYNGAVEATHTFLSALATIAIGYAPVNWSVYGEPVIAVISLFEGAMLYLAGSSNELWVAYVTYMAFCITYSVLITIASSEVAKGLKQESYGLVFGINTFLALFFQTILTLIVADSAGLALEPPEQFKVYGGYYFVLGVVFISMAAYNAGRRSN
ncbi:thiamine transporter 1-like [Daphnia pulicaria]|uniref:thiamine transporter 1-like n=1 Tax=Daphnia pulicaria TaxID=35523 RepID=UPI001EEAC218|nr:thiamine transporter 1-like [Daphnia pulicaria]XP_046639184.1 thiamine transporter 1-like [Daphnia pulicaria]